ncbi:hypothetical protein PSTEL_00555 [Paenibacillus stellifer]|uniref:Phage ABA sandwich domain-containing protein n=1 Tax=Paenibacillus stellifer TaxID=169760 RepID=A0A089LRM3_9BACL|nr:hypothetical protein [Paenibacillus stellifer]AIQ61843.1 hypothetical protein PSTEL_00555 [Paenibacillus stellifer]
MTLTREEILAMEPGRLLEAKVAELVMGLDMVEGQLPHLPRYFLSDYEKTIHRDVPLYSSDISAAWEVVEHMKSKNWEFIIASEDEKIDVTFYWDVHRMEGAVFVGTAPQAICKAALLAVLNL